MCWRYEIQYEQESFTKACHQLWDGPCCSLDIESGGLYKFVPGLLAEAIFYGPRVHGDSNPFAHLVQWGYPFYRDPVDDPDWGIEPAKQQPPYVHETLAYATEAPLEHVHESKALRYGFPRQRCLIPMTAFFEWSRADGGTCECWRFERADHSYFFAAGLWIDSAYDKGHLILTLPAADYETGRIQDRAPCIIRPEDGAAWLDPKKQTFEAAKKLCHAFSSRLFEIEVSRVSDDGILALKS